MQTFYKKNYIHKLFKNIYENYEVKILRHKKWNKNEKKMPPAFASTQKKEKKTVRLTCGVRAGRTARSESSARTPANARARNRNLYWQAGNDYSFLCLYMLLYL